MIMATFSQLPRDLICLVAQQDYKLVRAFLVLNKKSHRAIVNTQIYIWAEAKHLQQLRSDIYQDINKEIMSKHMPIRLDRKIRYDVDNDFIMWYEKIENIYSCVAGFNLKVLKIPDHEQKLGIWAKIDHYCDLSQPRQHQLSGKDKNRHLLIKRLRQLSKNKI